MPLGFIIIGIGGFGLVIFMYKRELFINPKAFRVILIISLIMLVLSYILPQFDAFKNTPVNVFKLPIITLLLYRIQRGFFKIAFDREPKKYFLDDAFGKRYMARYCFQSAVFLFMGSFLFASIDGYNLRKLKCDYS